MKPIKHPLMPYVQLAEHFDRRGRRTYEFDLRIIERDHFLREAARLHCSGMSDRAAAAILRSKLMRYRESAFRRERTEATCPDRHRGTITELLWMTLKVKDAVPSEVTIRRAFRDP